MAECTVMLEVSLVIPAYNESAVIVQAVQEAEAALSGRCARYEIIVVDDGSNDGTAEKLTELSGKIPHLRVIRHRSNRGYGAALASGFRAARCPWVAFTDADCQFDLRELFHLLEQCEEGVIVVGRRVGRKDPWLRRFLSWGYNRLVRFCFGLPVRDVDCALKVYPRPILRRLLPRSPGYFVNTEMLVRAFRQGWRIREVPVSHRPRAGGVSKVGLREVPRTALTLFRFWWRDWKRRWRQQRVFHRTEQVRPGLLQVWSGRLPGPLPRTAAGPWPTLRSGYGSRHPIGPGAPPPKAAG